MPEIAQRSGFTNPPLLHVAFRRETGITPGAYRRLFILENGNGHED